MDPKTGRRTKFLINILYYGVIAGIVFFSLRFAMGWFLPFIIGTFVAFLLEPAVNFMVNKMKLKRGPSGVILSIIFWAASVYLISLLIVLIISEISGFLSNISQYSSQLNQVVDNVQIYFNGLLDKVPDNVKELVSSGFEKLPETILTFASTLANKALTFLTGVLTSVPSALLFVLICVVSSCFISADFPKIKQFIILQVPQKQRGAVLSVKSFLKGTIFKLLKAYGLILFITFCELLVAFLLLGQQYAFTLALCIALMDILPVVGTGTAVIPWALYSFAVGDLKMGIGLAITYIVVLVVRQIIEPKIVGKQTGLHPVVTLMAMYIGVKAIGFAGIFIFPILLMFIKHMQDYGFIRSWNKASDKDSSALPVKNPPDSRLQETKEKIDYNIKRDK